MENVRSCVCVSPLDSRPDVGPWNSSFLQMENFMVLKFKIVVIGEHKQASHSGPNFRQKSEFRLLGQK